MKSISEAKDLLSRVKTVMLEFSKSTWEAEYSSQEVQDNYITIQKLLWLLYKCIDDLILEWEDEEGIDRPL